MRTESTRPTPQLPLIPNRPANTADIAEASHAEPNLAPSPTSTTPTDENQIKQQELVGIKSSKQTMKAVNEMATKEGAYFLKLDNGGHVRLSGKVNTLTESQKKTLVLVKLSELEHIKTPHDLNRVKNELKQLLQNMSQRGENSDITSFAKNTVLLTSASYQGASGIFENELYNASNSAKAYISLVDSYFSSP